eukprot:Phypoly_transcript_11476.p1 GENE.Phypoly_transcript_11476~~Phypoly_transcript_11476.p1  ORF type:complete len:211 (+),score=22.58 Phypoly_transcript_11476:566-1198(+)
MFLALYKNMEIERIDSYRYFFHLFSWGYAFVGAIIPMFWHQYGIMYPGSIGNLNWCWVADATSKFRLILYAPDFIIFALLNCLYGLIQFRIRGNQNSAAKRICKKMSIYVLVYAMINIFAIINRLQNYLSDGNGIFPLFLLQFLTQPLQGFLNAFAYAWNEPAFKDNYKNLFLKFRTKHVRSPHKQAEQERLIAHIHYDSDYPSQNVVIN